MRRIATCLLLGLVVSALMCASVWAQATAQISGTVKDQSGAVLPGVEITATQTGTGAARTAVTNETGSFVLPSLPLGPYRVEAGLPGFRTFVQTGIVLQVGSSATVNAVLEVGQVAETVEVQANASQVETRSVGISQVIETQRILELPLDGRQVENLITLSGAAVSSGTTNSGGARAVGGQFISVAGGLPSGVEYQLDGANHMNYAAGSGNALPFPTRFRNSMCARAALRQTPDEAPELARSRNPVRMNFTAMLSNSSATTCSMRTNTLPLEKA